MSCPVIDKPRPHDHLWWTEVDATPAFLRSLWEKYPGDDEPWGRGRCPESLMLTPFK